MAARRHVGVATSASPRRRRHVGVTTSSSEEATIVARLTAAAVRHERAINGRRRAVRADSRFRSITDLKGARVVWNEKGSGIATQASYLMSGLGLDMDRDFEALYPESRMDGAKMVIDGRAAALWGAGLRWPGFIELANGYVGARFVVPSAGEIKTVLAKHPFLREMSVPAGLYRGQANALKTVGTWSYLLARDGLDDDIGYRLANDLYRIEKAGTLSRLLVESTVQNTLASLPGTDMLQPGVMRFYKEKGLLQ